MKVAIIDDVKFMRDNLKEEILKIKNCYIKTFEFGSDFIKDGNKNDIIFLDGMLAGDLSSHEVIKFIINKNPE